ncbi:MAG: phosphoenolpyruvate--protein phosphotransferase [Burkholderiaceae bacterium]|jgi:phosphotransferase system enzyme I (PtsI)|nr:phosphoenolpyruvate--protein phosphotransferase [Burkholderiales bacterium]MCZ8101335.1 phosphoenolpyruvate--protein phosphotransferase [Burkholderiales bacterium]MCZ8338081.1 phosphoenolpyruvate--protein phosphotransferase [Burkholderiaceae bacterium]
MFALHGTGIGGGIVVGRAVVLESRLIDVPRYRVEFAMRLAETSRLARAVETVRAELRAIAEHLPADAPSEAQALLQVHAMILDDPSLAPQATVAIESHGQNAEWAFASQAEHLAAQFEQFEDPYLRERGRDVTQVADRVLKALSGSGRALRTRVPGEVPLIFVAHDVSPADMLQLKHAGGFAIDLGGTASHTAILARSMNVPAVVGLGHASQMVRDDDWLVLDGESGVLVVAPDESVLDEYRHRMALGLLERKQLSRLVNVPSATIDGVPIELHANIELPAEAEQAREAGAAGVGLFRTEFLFMNRAELPGEDEQFEAYRAAVLGMRGRPVTIRTLDIGADKSLDSSDDTQGPAAAPNPALGRRAIRYSLAEPDVFLEQLRAILRAAEHGPVRLLIPMLAHGHEVDQSLRLIAQARAQLVDRLGRDMPPVPVGGMIEVPAAALTAPFFARRLDFLSIGTNDLVQYTLAIDRADHAVASLYDPFHPAVLQLVAQTIRAGERAGKPVAVCGEMAGDLEATRLLIGMGLRSFSMHPASLLRVKREILRCDAGRLRARVARLLAADDPVKVRSGLERLRDA